MSITACVKLIKIDTDMLPQIAGGSAAAKLSVDAAGQFPQAEGLGHIVVAPGFQTLDYLKFIAAGG